MLLKRIDETLTQGLYDVTLPAEVEVGLIEPVMEEKVVYWKLVAKKFIPRAFLHYNDAADGGNKLNGCWMNFYASSANLGEFPLYNGTSRYFKGGTPNLGGVIKSAVYLRYSKGFLDWLSSFDLPAAEQLRKEIPAFDALIDKRSKKKKLSEKWFKCDKSATQIEWPLAAVCRLSNGKYLVHWLDKNCPDDKNLEKIQIDIPHSVELMSFLEEAEKTTRVVIHEEFQMSKGGGRNPFGKEYTTLDKIRDSEFMRLLGYIPTSNPVEMRQVLDTRLGYPIKVAPFPESSRLMFFPEGNLLYSDLKSFADDQAERWAIYEAWKERQKEKISDENEEIFIARPEILPLASECTVYLINSEIGKNKVKQAIQCIFPAVSLPYLARLNDEFVTSKIDFAIINYMRNALSGGRGDSPCIYQYWTKILTSALQHCEISAWDVYYRFSSYLRSYSCKDLASKSVVNRYFELIGKLLRLQQVITVPQQELEDPLQENEFKAKLELIGTFNLIPVKGVFGAMDKVMPAGKEIVGEAYEWLNDRLKARFDDFTRIVWGGMPTSEFRITMRGVLTGMLLCDLARQLNKSGRSFLVTQGRHSSQLRGRDLIQVFALGMDLLTNLGENPWFSRRLTPFILSIEQESNQESFNIGFTCGVFYQNGKEFNNSQEVKK